MRKIRIIFLVGISILAFYKVSEYFIVEKYVCNRSVLVHNENLNKTISNYLMELVYQRSRVSYNKAEKKLDYPVLIIDYNNRVDSRFVNINGFSGVCDEYSYSKTYYESSYISFINHWGYNELPETGLKINKIVEVDGQNFIYNILSNDDKTKYYTIFNYEGGKHIIRFDATGNEQDIVNEIIFIINNYLRGI